MSAPAAAPDRAERAADLGMWLFVASLVMFLASLVSGYVLLRAGSETWPTPWVGDGLGALADPWFRLLWLAIAAGTARAAGRDRAVGPAWLSRHPLVVTALAGAVFVVRTIAAGRALAAAGHGPASHVAPATWFALNGVLALLALGGVVATLIVARDAADACGRRSRLLARFWMLLSAAFAAIAVGMYLV